VSPHQRFEGGFLSANQETFEQLGVGQTVIAQRSRAPKMANRGGAGSRHGKGSRAGKPVSP
jgi:hypothetical protein